MEFFKIFKPRAVTKRDALVDALPANRRQVYEQAARLVAVQSFFSLIFKWGAGEKNESEQWKDFMLAFLNNPVDIPQYAARPETFGKDDFYIEPLSVPVALAIRDRKSYGTTGDYVYLEKDGDGVYLDAPFSYVLVFKGDERKEIISTVAFTPDFDKGRLNIDQLQGGNTTRKTASKEGRRARMKFREQPELMLFDAVRQLATVTGMKQVGLRKSSANSWTRVKVKDRTVYDRVAFVRGMQVSTSRDYYILPLEKKAAQQKTPQ